MAPTYYQIDLSGRALVGLVTALAVLLVLAFALGYGAAWSTLRSAERPVARLAPTPTPIPEVVVAPPDPVTPTATAPAPGASPTATAPVPGASPTPLPPATPTPRPPLPTPTRAGSSPPPTSTSAPAGSEEDAFWVQVIAVSRRDAVEQAREQLAGLGFAGDRQRVIETRVAGGSLLYKVRVGPFPDRGSADRVAVRMQAAGFNDAWVVAP